MGEAPASLPIVEFGCGSGRDALFFASRGLSVVGLDRSIAAIEYCEEIARERELNHAKFQVAEVGDEQTYQRLNLEQTSDFAVYSRFFLHSISEQEEELFLRGLQSLENLKFIGLEFRTAEDANRKKVTKPHYRRFVELDDFLEKTRKLGFIAHYVTAGLGFAKYGDDDAYVARVLLRTHQ